jgi:hypothetical protein
MELKNNIDKIHTTPMGVERIKRNLNLSCDVVVWCKDQVIKSTDITRKGKNWYIITTDRKAVITINAHSYTIITAHIV